MTFHETNLLLKRGLLSLFVRRSLGPLVQKFKATRHALHDDDVTPLPLRTDFKSEVHVQKYSKMQGVSKSKEGIVSFMLHYVSSRFRGCDYRRGTD
jgi:hypothetical protein